MIEYIRWCNIDLIVILVRLNYLLQTDTCSVDITEYIVLSVVTY